MQTKRQREFWHLLKIACVSEPAFLIQTLMAAVESRGAQTSLTPGTSSSSLRKIRRPSQANRETQALWPGLREHLRRDRCPSYLSWLQSSPFESALSSSQLPWTPTSQLRRLQLCSTFREVSGHLCSDCCLRAMAPGGADEVIVRYQHPDDETHRWSKFRCCCFSSFSLTMVRS